MDVNELITKFKDHVVPVAATFGSRFIGAIALWIIGRMVIGLVRRATRHAAQRRDMDATLTRYLDSTVNMALQIVLVVSIFGVFGVETTTFAGLLAAAGVAIGMAWSGLLSNFAAGLFMIVLRPFKVGDMVTVAGVTGDVQELGMFVTTIHTPDNLRVFVGNAKIFADVIHNYTANPVRRVELTAQLAGSVDPKDAIKRLKAALAKIPNVATNPAPQVDILTFSMAGPILAVRPFTHNNTYWDVYFATNMAIAEVCAEAGYPPAENYFHARILQLASPTPGK